MVITDKELLPCAVEWLTFNLDKVSLNVDEFLDEVHKLNTTRTDNAFKTNLSAIILSVLSVLARKQPSRRRNIERMLFSGSVFEHIKISQIVFKACTFCEVSFSNNEFTDCEFVDCDFGRLSVHNSSATNVLLKNSMPVSLTIDDDELFSPEQIKASLEEIGFSFEDVVPSIQPKRPLVDAEVIKSVTRIIRWSNKYYNIAEEELLDRYGPEMKPIVDAGVKSNVFRELPLAASGSKKHFFRITSDRDELLKGQIGRTRDSKINEFWSILAEKYPAK
jgi:hypothetical protein